jgi:ABC-type multidrug transport system fused ATPase/permease subunit
VSDPQPSADRSREPGATSDAEESDEASPGLPLEEAIPGLRLTSGRLRALGRPYRAAIAGTSALALAVTASRIAQALLVAHLLGQILHRRTDLVPSLVAMAAVTTARLVLLWLRDRRAEAVAATVGTALRGRLWSHLRDLGPGYLVRHRTGAVETTMVGGIDGVAWYFGEFVPLAVAAVVSVAVLLVWITALDPVTGLVLLGAASLVPAAPVLSARAFGEVGVRFSRGLGRLAAEYLDAIQGLLTLKAFNAGDAWGRRLASQCEELSADATSLGGLSTMHVGFVSLAMAVGTLGGVAVATLRTTHGAVSGSALIAILLLARECFRPLGELQAAFPAAYQAVAQANGVVELLGTASEVPEPASPLTIDRARFVPSISFEAVEFAYRDDRPPALQGISFDVAPGETVAIVGPSGAGKTTLVSLLLRFFDPQAGVVRLGGCNVADLARQDLRSLVSVTFQDTYLFHRSVRDNLLLARPGATRDQVEAAARAARAHDFVVALPEGYDTVVGERGTRLSGGERQRLAIARALLADTPVLVLDEPTSSVDAESEALITDALDRLTVGRTTIVIAHRLSTVRRADRVVVLDRGRVVETGSPSELRFADGVFARLVAAQELSA